MKREATERCQDNGGRPRPGGPRGSLGAGAAEEKEEICNENQVRKSKNLNYCKKGVLKIEATKPTKPKTHELNTSHEKRKD